MTLIPVGPDNQRRGLIELAVLAQTADGIPSNEILENVRAVVTSRAVRTLGSSPRVVAATTRPFDVRARVWLRTGAAVTIADGLEARLRKAFARERGLGFDVAPSWIIAQLQGVRPFSDSLGISCTRHHISISAYFLPKLLPSSIGSL